MFRRRLPFLFALGLGTACASTSPANDVVAESTHVELAAGAWQSMTLDETVTVHSLVAPEAVLAVTSHVIETSGHVVVVDTQLTTPHAKQLVAKIREIGKPVARIFISHGHPDHYFGIGEVMQLGVDVEALPAARAHMRRRYKSHQAGHKKMEGDAIPDVIHFPAADLVPGSFAIDGVDFVAEEIAGAEDVEQVLLWLPAQKALVAQDLVSNGYHAFFGTGPVDAWRRTLDELHKRGPVVVFAGHGAPGDASLLTATSEYLAKAAQLVAVSTSEKQLTEDVLAAFPERKGAFLVEVSSLIIFRDRARDGKAAP